jgi:hypothetical protein
MSEAMSDAMFDAMSSAISGLASLLTKCEEECNNIEITIATLVKYNNNKTILANLSNSLVSKKRFIENIKNFMKAIEAEAANDNIEDKEDKKDKDSIVSSTEDSSSVSGSIKNHNGWATDEEENKQMVFVPEDAQVNAPKDHQVEDFSEIEEEVAPQAPQAPPSPLRNYAEIAGAAVNLPAILPASTPASKTKDDPLIYGTFNIPFANGKKTMVESLNDIQQCMRKKKKDERFGFIHTKNDKVKVVVHNPKHSPSSCGEGYNSDVDDEFTFSVGPYAEYKEIARDAIASIWPKLKGVGNIVVITIIGPSEDPKIDNTYKFFHVKVGADNNGRLFINDDDIYSEENITWRKKKGI